MRQECVIYANSHNDSTPDEPWTTVRTQDHHYNMQADFALEGLGKGPGRCLVIGSPLFEATELAEAGWDVTYVDVRQPPGSYPFEFILGDASNLDLGHEVYDVASTTCVLCHAGLGRYGDPVVEDADELIVKSMFNAMKPGAQAVVTFGPVGNMSLPIRYGNTHRIYNYQTALGMVRQFKILKVSTLDTEQLKWVAVGEFPEQIGRDYLSMLLEKP